MEIPLYKASIEAGVKEDTAARVADSLEAEIRERMQQARQELATRADIADLRKELAEARADIIKWNLGTISAFVGVMPTLSKAFA